MKKTLPVFVLVLGLLPLPGCRPNNAPVVTELSGPPSGRIDSTYLFVAHAADPDGDAVAIRFDWDNGDTSDWSAPVQSALPVRLSYVWPDGDSYEVRCQARDRRGAHSDWSGPRSVFILGNRRPEAPDCESWPELCNVDSAVLLRVHASDPDNDIVRYRCDLGNGDTTAWSDWVASDSETVVTCVWPARDSCQYRLQAQDVRGAPSDWTEPREMWVLPAPGIPRWTFTPGDKQWSCPAVGTDGTIYIGCSAGAVHAVNPDGTRKWARVTGGGINSSPSIGPDGAIYACSNDNYLYALHPDGSVRWRHPVPVDWGTTCAAVADDGTIYVGADDSCLYAVNPDGTLKWRHCLGGTIRTPPAIAADGTVHVGSGEYLCAVNPDSTLRWRCLLGHRLWEGMAVGSDGTIYACGENGMLYAVSPDSSIRWAYDLDCDLSEASPVIGADGTIYVGPEEGHFTALNRDGEVKWEREGRWHGAALAADGTIYVGRGDLLALNPDGSVRWAFLPGDGEVWAAPTVAPDGTIYVGSTRTLYALPGTSPLANSPWPKYQHDLFNSGRAGGP